MDKTTRENSNHKISTIIYIANIANKYHINSSNTHLYILFWKRTISLNCIFKTSIVTIFETSNGIYHIFRSYDVKEADLFCFTKRWEYIIVVGDCRAIECILSLLKSKNIQTPSSTVTKGSCSTFGTNADCRPKAPIYLNAMTDIAINSIIKMKT